MEERQVTVDGRSLALPDPFVVVATQNPVEYEGTYPLPEAQLDRFLLKLTVPLPERTNEIAVLARHHGGFNPRDLAAAGVSAVAGKAQLDAGRAAARRVSVRPEVLAYIVDVCRATRTSPSLSLGASPRGATAMLNTAKAWAWLSGRDFVTPDDVKALAKPNPAAPRRAAARGPDRGRHPGRRARWSAGHRARAALTGVPHRAHPAGRRDLRRGRLRLAAGRHHRLLARAPADRPGRRGRTARRCRQARSCSSGSARPVAGSASRSRSAWWSPTTAVVRSAAGCATPGR